VDFLIAAVRAANVSYGFKAALTAPNPNFRFDAETGLKSDISPLPFGANSGSKRGQPLIEKRLAFCTK